MVAILLPVIRSLWLTLLKIRKLTKSYDNTNYTRI